MGKIYDEIDQQLERFILTQHIFFVSTAPLGADGHINLSPKGLESIRLLDPHTLAYLDYVGSGAETIAHLRENGRVGKNGGTRSGPLEETRGKTRTDRKLAIPYRAR